MEKIVGIRYRPALMVRDGGWLAEQEQGAGNW